MGTTRRTAGRRAGLDAGKVADAACALAGERGLNGWTMRELAAKLGVAPSVIYHYYPNRDDLTSAIIDRIVARIELPPDDLDWKEWFSRGMKALRAELLAYNGVADQMMMGSFTPSFLPLFDRAFAKLDEAGFGSATPMAYTMIVNVALGAIAGKDHRSRNERTMPHDLDAMLERFRLLVPDSDNLRRLFDEFLGPLAAQDANGRENKLSERYFDLIMQSILTGVEQTLLPGNGALPANNAV